MIGSGSLIVGSNNREYILSDHLDTGSFSQVYQALLQSADELSADGIERTVVAKVGRIQDVHRETAVGMRQRIRELKEVFESELQLIRELGRFSNDRFVPWVEEGRLVLADSVADESENQVPILLMQDVPRDWYLGFSTMTSESGSDGIAQGEIIGVEAGAQYVEMLDILHSKLDTACGDRKPVDLRWDKARRRLYVLDWNVTEALPEGNDERTRKIARDTALFARMWFGLLAEVEPTDGVSDQVENPPDGTPWAQLSQGTRRLLQSTLELSRSDETGGRLVDQWRSWADMLSQGRASALDAAQKTVDQIDDIVWKKQLLYVRDLVDLAKRLGATADDRISLTVWLETYAERRLEKFPDAFLRSRDGVEQVEAYQSSSRTLDTLRQDSNWDFRQRLKASRWFIAANILSELAQLAEKSQNSTNSKSFRQELLNAIDALDRDPESLLRSDVPASTRVAIDHCREWLSRNARDATRARDLLQVLAHDYDFHVAVDKIKSPSSDDEELQALGLAQQQLRDVSEVDGEHSRLLLESVGIDVHSRRAQLDRARQDLADDLKGRRLEKQALGRASRLLSDAINSSPPEWPDIRSEAESLSTTSRIRSALLSVQESVQDSIDITSLDAVKTAVTLLRDAEYMTLSDNLRNLFATLVAQRLETLSSVRWPSDVHEASVFVEALSGSGADWHGSALDGNVRLFEVRQALIEARRIQRKFLELNTSNNHSADLVPDTNDQIDTLLNEAKRLDIELLEHHGTRPLSVEQLLTMRESVRIKRQLVALEKGFDKLITSEADWSNVVTNISSILETRAATINSVEQTLKELEKSHNELTNNEMIEETSLENLESRVARLKAMVTVLKPINDHDLSEGIDSAYESIRNILHEILPEVVGELLVANNDVAKKVVGAAVDEVTQNARAQRARSTDQSLSDLIRSWRFLTNDMPKMLNQKHLLVSRIKILLNRSHSELEMIRGEIPESRRKDFIEVLEQNARHQSLHQLDDLKTKETRILVYWLRRDA